MDVFGKVLKDYFKGKQKSKLWLHNSYGKPEDMPVDVFFRSETDLSELEKIALNLCSGTTLDIGAGVGSHALFLQKKGIEVTAIEHSAQACEIMRARGVKNVINMNVMQYNESQYDTLLMMMNGIGLCEDIQGLHKYLDHLKNLLAPGGQVLFDSSDIAYLYHPDDFLLKKYYGEISYQYEYQNIKGSWFKWLYIDFPKLSRLAEEHGWTSEMIYEDDTDQYLASLRLA
ncbi:class I SAM-dependent methyltransferase [Daejeonella sp. H1SJ63]|jgi:SAM-dependent methyltransferase|uniref:class I SAM-dependent methyltransferase n=1 Tax=Daejeonella sp. H1SJ63 TaxID=3034145 RepID=UPI0023EC58A3|nr:class I SAM-dependent methyltransferase [Daejeonella sp. H1SJ63]